MKYQEPPLVRLAILHRVVALRDGVSDELHGLVEVEADLRPIRAREALRIPGGAIVVVAGSADLLGLDDESLLDRAIPVDHDLLLAVVLARAVAGLALHSGGSIELPGDHLVRHAVGGHVALDAVLCSLWISDAPLLRPLLGLVGREGLQGLGVLGVEPPRVLVADLLFSVTGLALLDANELVFASVVGESRLGDEKAPYDEEHAAQQSARRPSPHLEPRFIHTADLPAALVGIRSSHSIAMLASSMRSS